MKSLVDNVVSAWKSEGFLHVMRSAPQYVKCVMSQNRSKFSDVIVRRLLKDEHTLPIHNRRVSDYIQTRRRASFIYHRIHSHTNLGFTDNIYDSGNDINSRLDLCVGDIGCGDGAVAVEFYENHPEINYTGLDINRTQLKQLEDRFSDTNYDFIHTDIRNERYNPGGKIDPAKFSFPFPNNHFDLLILKSVFTHLRPDVVKNYLSEIQRILRSEGSAWTTWFVITSPEDQHCSKFHFQYDFGKFHTRDRENPESAIAYQQTDIRRMVSSQGLEIDRQILGYWRDSISPDVTARDNQDVLILTPR